ncbi:glyoxalase [Haloarcula sp. S1CR25-12]|uniref:Glyoxalase n=1 Tax=Haloarcula saliterrae TaxID=2950534 RepID=A0ABU2FF20_9EURY|nr:VOC family protein [Haloarcula sp. S1CR25-12]MDS0260839.1 glyoxalase [Haloarcula sp. S1CR25-12]
MPKLKFITFSCRSPDELADFWAAALDGDRRALPDALDSAIVERPDDGPDLLFNDHPTDEQRDLPIHLDVSADDREAAVERLRDLGATVRETKTEAYETHTSTWTVLEDPEGNGFCVTEYP